MEHVSLGSYIYSNQLYPFNKWLELRRAERDTNRLSAEIIFQKEQETLYPSKIQRYIPEIS